MGRVSFPLAQLLVHTMFKPPTVRLYCRVLHGPRADPFIIDVQITGAGDLTKLNIPKGDDGGELDPHGADGNGNPIGGLVFGTSYGGIMRQFHEWTNFMSSGNFCFRVCLDGPNAPKYCGHVSTALRSEFSGPNMLLCRFTMLWAVVGTCLEITPTAFLPVLGSQLNPWGFTSPLE